jgi:hypothetical protein
MVTKRKTPYDAGLAEIDDLERNIILGREQLWAWNGVPAEEIARLLPGGRDRSTRSRSTSAQGSEWRSR